MKKKSIKNKPFTQKCLQCAKGRRMNKSQKGYFRNNRSARFHRNKFGHKVVWNF